ncbi:MAG: RNA 2',3'-cyclic phosphodiesterase [Beijerinckiaceae bacterium]|nr:RNA 2',3'-cyclic phosphodiesterase [Beijerinckiaceae bacterium]
MPRLFTALELPEHIAADLATLRGGLPGARWIDVENYHITLRFIGDIGEAEAREIHALLARMQRKPLTVTLEGLAAFGGGKPRAIVAAVKPEAPLLELQAGHERLMRRLGLTAETRKFAPHVTLARLRQTSPLAVADYIAAQGFLPARSFEAQRFVLMSSRDSLGGGPYVIEAAYPLDA